MWAFLRTHSGTQAVPAFYCFFFDTDILKTQRHAGLPMLKEAQTRPRHVFWNPRFDTRVFVFETHVFAHLRMKRGDCYQIPQNTLAPWTPFPGEFSLIFNRLSTTFHDSLAPHFQISTRLCGIWEATVPPRAWGRYVHLPRRGPKPARTRPCWNPNYVVTCATVRNGYEC